VPPSASRYPLVWRRSRRPLLQLNPDGPQNRNGQWNRHGRNRHGRNRHGRNRHGRNLGAPLNPGVNQSPNVPRNPDGNQSPNAPPNPDGSQNLNVRRNPGGKQRPSDPWNLAARRNLGDQSRRDAQLNPNAHANDKKNRRENRYRKSHLSSPRKWEKKPPPP
jgi:hypothetical protein